MQAPSDSSVEIFLPDTRKASVLELVCTSLFKEKTVSELWSSFPGGVIILRVMRERHYLTTLCVLEHRYDVQQWYSYRLYYYGGL